MNYQTTSRIVEGIHHFGCKYLSTCRIFELVTHRDLSVDEVNKIYEVCQKVGYIGKGGNMEGFVYANGTRGIAQVASGITGYGCYMEQVSNNDSFNYIIARFSRRTSSGRLLNHFPLVSLGDMETVIYDPWSKEGSKTVRLGSITGYRYVYAEAI